MDRSQYGEFSCFAYLLLSHGIYASLPLVAAPIAHSTPSYYAYALLTSVLVPYARILLLASTT
ncbi:hypothetical protein BC834DRAFT_884598 [Gloeopeniophorella convolvens]|nr:hypothetical protein BC834DRAFT_884598 [Gloeopeniophorella convolvens]